MALMLCRCLSHRPCLQRQQESSEVSCRLPLCRPSSSIASPALRKKQQSHPSQPWLLSASLHTNRSDFSTSRPCCASTRRRARLARSTGTPAAQHVLVSAVGDHTMKLRDLGVPESPRAMLVGHADTIQSFAFSPTGQLLVTASRDRKLR